jgi:L-ascorbate 6-phosphate lactonase
MFYDINIPEDKAALWFLGQAGYYVKACGTGLLIDPYLSDSAGKDPRFGRIYPVPVDPQTIHADLFIVTHDHLDHLDPETIAAYGSTKSTRFIAPRFAAGKLRRLGIDSEKITVVDHGGTAGFGNVKVTGVFALATSPDVVDTTGYLIQFKNGKSLYHTSDASWCDLLKQSAPYADVLLTCINGKYGNLNAAQSVELTRAVNPMFALPNHYDVMALNGENPEVFRYLCSEAGFPEKCVIPGVLEPFIW